MKDIYPEELGTADRLFYRIGWLNVINIIFWLIMIIVYSTRHNDSKYKKFINPHTKKVIYIYGWITYIVFILNVGAFLGTMIFLYSLTIPYY